MIDEYTSWHSYADSATLGHKMLTELFFDPVVIEEKIDGCVTPDTLILKADLSYVQAGSLRVGDALVAFDDKLVSPHLRPATVTIAAPIIKDCLEIVTESRKVIASGDHPWLIAKPDSHGPTTHTRKRWRTTVQLQPGDMIMALPVWEFDASREAGELAGFYNGEGSLVRHKNQRILSAYQAVGPTADAVQKMLRTRGFTVSVDTRQRRSEWKTVASIVVRGGWTEALRFLGSIRPLRLLADAGKIWQGAGMNYIPRERVISVRSVGLREVTGLSTSTGTYVAEGLLCHNSQFAFGSFGPATADLKFRSKGAQIFVTEDGHSSEKMFEKAVQSVISRQYLLHEGWTYRAEYLPKPKAVTLAYDRVPVNAFFDDSLNAMPNYLIGFDIETADECFLTPTAKRAEFTRIGLETVPCFFEGRVSDIDTIKALLDTVSILGGQKIEGVVIKNYYRFGQDKKILIGKYVSKDFKELHGQEWKKGNPKQGDIVQEIIESLRTPARWAKGVQHLREAGTLTDTPRDIAMLFQEVPKDIKKEEETAIKDALFTWAWPKISRGATAGLAEWYKERLLEGQVIPAGHEPVGPLYVPYATLLKPALNPFDAYAPQGLNPDAYESGHASESL